VFENVLNLSDRYGRVRPLIGRPLIGRRSRLRAAEAAEVAEIDRWLDTIRSGPDMVLYSAHPAPARSAPPRQSRQSRRSKKRRR